VNCAATSDVTKVCGTGALNNMATINGSITFNSPLGSRLPNMYSLGDVVTVQGLLTAAVQTLAIFIATGSKSLPSAADLNTPPTPFGLNYLKPLQVVVYNYTYYNAKRQQLSSYSGLPPSALGEAPDADFEAASTLDLQFVFIMPNLDEQQAMEFRNILAYDKFPYFWLVVFGASNQQNYGFSTSASSAGLNQTFPAQPLGMPLSNGATSSHGAGAGVWLTFVLPLAIAIVATVASGYTQW